MDKDISKNKIQLADHFTYGRIIRFVFPTIIMMITSSIYSVVDGFFVSNYVGKIPFAAINFVMPLLFIMGAVGYMAGSGGSAIVAFTLGEGKKELAEEYFTLIALFTATAGLVLAFLGLILIRSALGLMGGHGPILTDSVVYGRIVLITLPCYMLSNMFHSFFITAQKPRLGLYMSVFSGTLNVLLDVVFVIGFRWGLAGVAFATAISQSAGVLLELIYFGRKNDSLLRFRRPRFSGQIILRTCTNGSSEMVNTIAASVISALYNYQLMRYAGADGVAAYGIIIYAGYLFSSCYYGYSAGCAPVISFHNGAGDTDELKNLFHISVRVIGSFSLAMILLVRVFGSPVTDIFAGYDQGLFRLTLHAFYIYSLSFLPGGYAVFISSLFTALENGKISALISFLKTFVFESSSILLLPSIFGLDGIWWAIIAAETAAFLLAVCFLARKRERYQYY